MPARLTPPFTCSATKATSGPSVPQPRRSLLGPPPQRRSLLGPPPSQRSSMVGSPPPQRRSLLGPPPSQRSSLVGPPPPQRRSLLGPPPTITRIPGSPKPLSVFFCNLHGRPRKLPSQRKPFQERMLPKQQLLRLPKTSALSKSITHFSKPKEESAPLTTASVPNLVADIVSGIFENIAFKEPSDSPENEENSVISLDNSSITDQLGNPVHDDQPPSSQTESSSPILPLN